MSAFTKTSFEYSSGFLYFLEKGERKFVARFKYNGPFTKAKFIKQLIKNHTPSEYFRKLEEGQSPLKILRDADQDWYFGLLNLKSKKSV